MLPAKHAVIEQFTEKYLSLRVFFHNVIKTLLQWEDPEGPPIKGFLNKFS